MATPVVDAHGVTPTGGEGTSENGGLKILTKAAVTLTKITKESVSTATRALLLDSSKSTLATASFSGDDATFSYALSDATTYYVIADNSGSSYTRSYKAGGASFPITGTNIDWTGGLRANSDNTQVDNIKSVTTQDPNVTIEPAAIALSTSTEIVNKTIQVDPISINSGVTIPNPNFIIIPPSSTFVVGTGTIGQQVINKNYPNIEGLQAGTTKQRKDWYLK